MVKLSNKLNSMLILIISILSILIPNVQSATLTVCGSGCNSTTIQGAIDLASSGDTISVAAGSYQGDIIINKSLILQGAGRTVTTILRNTSVSQVVLIQASNVTITGFKIDGGGTAPYLCNNIINLSTAGSPPYENIEITDSHLLHSQLSSINLYGKVIGRHYKVNDNIIEYFGCDAACSDDSGGIGVSKALDVEIKRNIIREANSDPGFLTYSVTGIYFMDYTGGTIADNSISHVYGAIMINSNVEETYVDNNTISGTLMGLSQTESFAKVHFTGNTIITKSDPLDAGYYQRGISLGGDGDSWNSCPGYEHEVDNLQHEVSGNIITGDNTANSLGIRVKPGMIDIDWGASGMVTDNVISNYSTGLAIYGKSNTGGDLTSHVHVSFADNSITGSAIYASATSWTGGAGSINATNNWWGLAIPNSSKFSVKIAYYPFCLNAGCTANIEDEISEFTGDCTTNFSAISNWSDVDLLLDAANGMLNWTNPMDLTGSNLRFSDAVEIIHRSISVDSSMMPELDSPAVLTFKNAGFSNTEQFEMYRNGAKCPKTICTKISISNGNVILETTKLSHFTLMPKDPFLLMTSNLIVIILLAGGILTFLTLILVPREFFDLKELAYAMIFILIIIALATTI